MGRKVLYRQPYHVALSYKLLNSKVYKVLPNASAKALPLFYAKVKLTISHPNRHYAQFAFPYHEAKVHGFSPATFSKIIKNLVHYGLIDPVDKGGLRGVMGEEKTNNVFRLSKRWERYGCADFQFVEWETFSPQRKSKPASVLETYRFKKGKETPETGGSNGKGISVSEAGNEAIKEEQNVGYQG